MKLIKGLFLSFLAIGFASCDDDDDNENIEPVMAYSAELSEINDSGASGTATISVQGDEMTVNIFAQGMTPEQSHPQHIHGFDDANMDATCPPASADENEDGIITLEEGVPSYGGVVLELKDFPMADANGNISYEKTFMLGNGSTPTEEELADLENRVIVLHGINNDGTYEATIPAACGELEML